MNICEHWKELDNEFGCVEYCRAINSTTICAGVYKQCNNKHLFKGETNYIGKIIFTGNRQELKGYLNLLMYLNGRNTKVAEIARCK